VRQRAVEALATIGSPGAIDLLSEVLGRDPSPFVRYEALVGLELLGGEEAIGSLRSAARDTEELIAVKARELLEMSPRHPRATGRAAPR
jgi:HEAT repeat protein